MIEIEFPDAEISKCDCCGGATTSLTRFVTKDGDAFAVYYAAFSDEHPENGIAGIVSFGEWWIAGQIPESRIAFAFELWADENEFKVTIVDAAKSAWSDVNIIGRKLSREEALAHPMIDDVFHITGHMTSQDPAITGFFAQETIH